MRLSRLRFDSEPTLQCPDSSSHSSISLQLQLWGITHCPPAHGNIGLPIDYTAGHRELDFFNNRQTQRRQSDTAVWSKWSTEMIWTQSCLRAAVSFKHAGSPGSLFACHLWAPEASSTWVGRRTKTNQWRLSSYNLHHMTQKLELETSETHSHFRRPSAHSPCVLHVPLHLVSIWSCNATKAKLIQLSPRCPDGSATSTLSLCTHKHIYTSHIYYKHTHLPSSLPLCKLNQAPLWSLA